MLKKRIIKYFFVVPGMRQRIKYTRRAIIQQENYEMLFIATMIIGFVITVVKTIS